MQSFYFNITYLFNLILYLGSLAIFLIIIINRVTIDDMTNKSIDITGLLFQSLSRFCTIQSCFIFFTVSYSVLNRCDDVLSEFVETDMSGERENFCDSLYIQELLGQDIVTDLWRREDDDYKEALKKAQFAALRKIDDN